MKFRVVAAVAALQLATAALAQPSMSSGEVTKVDKAASRVTLKHGEIKNLDMPPMTMAFRVREAAMLNEIGVGDRVQFVAERVDGSYMVTLIKRLR